MFKKDFILEIIEIIWVSRKLQKGFDPIVLRLKYRHWRITLKQNARLRLEIGFDI